MKSSCHYIYLNSLIGKPLVLTLTSQYQRWNLKLEKDQEAGKS